MKSSIFQIDRFKTSPKKSDRQNLEDLAAFFRALPVDQSAVAPQVQPAGAFPYACELLTAHIGRSVLVRSKVSASFQTMLEEEKEGDCIEILFNLKGHMAVSTQSGTVSLSASSFLIKDRSVPYRLYFKDDCEFFYLNFSQDYFFAHAGHPILNYFGHVFSDRTPAQRLFKNALLVTFTTIEQLAPQDCGEVCDGLLCFLRPSLFEFFRIHAKKEKSSTEKIRQTAIDLMANRYLSVPGFKIEMLAHECGVSTRYLSEVFRAIGITPKHMMTRIKMERAACYLREPHTKNNRLEEIARDLGFKNSAHFCRVFKKYYGVTPKSYRS